MGQVTLELSDETIQKAAMLAARKGVALTTFLAYQINELIAANDRYERAKASVLTMFPDAGELPDMELADPTPPDQFFDRWRHRPPGPGPR